MKPKHIKMRIRQCLVLSELSGCPRRKFGAMLIDPERNVILSDAYNGGPRGGGYGSLCRGNWCERNGLSPEDVEVGECKKDLTPFPRSPVYTEEYWKVAIKGQKVWEAPKSREGSLDEAEKFKQSLIDKYQKIDSGKQMERGCHHAESNVICNAASNGVSTKGSWLIVTGEPCLMCAKLVHHAGITKVICVENGYKGGKDGPEYLSRHGVKVEYTSGPEDPRA